MTDDGIARPRVRTRERLGPSPAESMIRAPTVGAAVTERAAAARRVERLLLLRTLVITVVLGLSIWLAASAEQPSRAAVWVQSAIIVVTYLTSIAFGVALRRGASPETVARPMQLLDLVISSLLVYVTGGAQSPYTFLYALSIVGAGALAFRRGAAIVTAASLGAMTLIALLAWQRVELGLPMVTAARPWEQSAADLVRTLGVNVAALAGVGVLALIFGDQLQRGGAALASARAAAADLLTLHQDIVRSIASGLITVSPDGTVLTANQAAADILRAPGEALAGEPIEAVMPGLMTELGASMELRRADLVLGEGLTIGVTVSPLRDVENRVIGRIVNFQDLTELRRLESHARRSERLATVGQLAAGVAHEIRNPLASISGSIELLRQAPQASEDDRTLMAIVHREIQRLNLLIGDLLDYANPRPLQAVDFDLGVLVDETLQVARRDAAFGDVEVEADVQQPLRVHGDPAKLRQVLWNLLRNAADAAVAGGRHVQVEAFALDNGETQFAVADDGPGIPPEQLARIFDPFFTTKSKGTGLGLATCFAIVADHGGHIDAESDVGRGTKMVVTLPGVD